MSIRTVCVRNMSFEGTLPLRVACSGTNVFYRNMIYYSKNKVPASTRAFLRHICLPCQYIDRLCFQPYQYKFLIYRLFSSLLQKFHNCQNIHQKSPPSAKDEGQTSLYHLCCILTYEAPVTVSIRRILPIPVRTATWE